MRVMIENRLINPEETPVILYLTKQERDNIANMPENATGIYATFSEDIPKVNRENLVESMKKRLKRDSLI